MRARTGKAVILRTKKCQVRVNRNFADSRHGCSNEKEEDTKIYGLCIDELVVYTITDGSTSSKRNYEADQTDCDPSLGILSEDAEVCFQADEEEKEDQTNVCDQSQVWDRRCGKNRVGEARDATHD